MRCGAPHVHDSPLANSIYTAGILQKTRRESPGFFNAGDEPPFVLMWMGWIVCCVY
jgi:hypothetical protein